MRARHILLTTFGSLGDLHPYLAIARELRRRGHRPAAASIEQHRAAVEAAGIQYRPLWSAAVDAGKAEIVRRALHPHTGPRYIVRELVMPELSLAYRDTLAAAADAEVPVTHPLTLATRLVAEVLGLPPSRPSANCAGC